jgi:lipopolysaccharide/colanic/teichoic acid biosynthesis glycosyltransferase
MTLAVRFFAYLAGEWRGIMLFIIAPAILFVLLSAAFYRPIFKRFYDIIFSLIGLPFFLLIFIPVAIAIKIEDGGSIFYCGKRLGKKGKVFKMFKFRSMKVNAPDIRLDDGSTFNSDNDPRVTRVGRFLRKTSIDETAQILNIFFGYMSFIGPRPDLPEAIDLLTDEEKIKLKVRPGVAGYSQARVRNSVEWKERIKYDIIYAKKLSIFFDIRIIFMTVKTVLLKKNLYSEALGKEIAAPLIGDSPVDKERNDDNDDQAEKIGTVDNMKETDAEGGVENENN